ncbi:WD40 repeat-like protein [Aspergillus steynii IBT 23096]|uniref:WD40 repeat-like protein n=1 Tax=Aspergillus steynii IBT 23096 TaxID=1392250 RepID=A0A2I2FR41_9EURO|nr:WD40 repeat-like protein [Aspergillus steynii IBT 23096]PLB43104.1 WD40 repeat-like protein [Aspergillus steynii IBT 23096]
MPTSMSQQHSNMRSRSFGFGPSPNFGQVESENTSIIEEARNLLSQFMKHSSHKTQEPQKDDSGGSEGRAISHNISGSLEKEDPDSTNPWPMACANSESFTLERKPRKQNNLAQQSPSDEFSKYTTYRPERQQILTYQESSKESLKPSHERATALPRSGRKRSFSPKQPATLDLEMDQNKYQITGTRRSGRSKSGPTNYYEPVCLFNLDSDEDSEPSQTPPSMETLPSRAHDKDIKPPPHTQQSAIFSSQGLRIMKLRFKTVAELKDLEHACYSPELNPANYARRIIKGPEAVLHVDFGDDEMMAVLELLSLHGLQWTANPEISLADQVIQALSSCTVSDEITLKLSWIYKLSHVLASQGVHGDSTSILKLLQSPGERDIVHVQRLMAKVLGQRERNNGGQHQIEEIHQLAAYLQCASKLYRRHHRDIDTFIKDAKKGNLPSIPCVVKAIVSQTQLPPGGRPRCFQKFGQLLQNRELGCNVNRKINSDVASNFKLCKKWKGASNDVVVMAWSPDGTRFAAGATAQCDEHNMEYNRGNNLLLGDLTRNCLEELPDHCIPRPERSGVNRAVNDTRLFMSVTAVQWFDDFLFTGSYDNTVKLWDFAGGKASCCKTLRHDAKVQVMARSALEHNVLATGTHAIGLWNIGESTYTPLEPFKHRHRKDIELVPTSLAWGTVPSTKNILLAGFAEKHDEIPQNGLLAAWHIGEAEAIPLPFLPNSQNIFDIKWHPTSGAFVTGSSTGLKNIGSVVRHYEPLKSRRGIYEFDCPALDINDVTFCPVNSNYVTASCTDGNTYVWDYRKNNDVVLKLPHGGPLNQTDETLTREQADVGVRVALWGNGIDQFYTGASDGVLKRWNVLKSSEDALVEDTACLEEEIMSATISDDKSNLLVGDAAGGIHVLSSGPFFNTDERSFTFERATQLPCEDYEPEPESGLRAGRGLLSSGQLSLHPVYGVGQGPHYTGPFAAWARPEGTPDERVAQTPLRTELQIRQLDGIPLERRSGLDEQSRRDVGAQIQLARIRNLRQGENKRKRVEPASPMTSLGDNVIDLCSDGEGQPRSLTLMPGKPKRRAKARSREPLIVNMEGGVIDLTGDTDSEELADASPGLGLDRVKELEEALDEDFWWPPSHSIDPNIQDGSA